jgi:membrane protein insertase Oxa1/YidC/SpoIIIJ
MADFLYTIIIYPIAQIIEFVFVLAQKVFKVSGISVLAVSAAISILTLPLYIVAEKWQQLERDTQKRLKAKSIKIKAVFKGDEQYMILSTYWRQNQYHPIYALRSSFGLLIQIPFFIAAYVYLSHLDVLKGASFLSIRDLGSPDALIPLFGGLNLLPILMTVINIAAGAVYLRGFSLKDKAQLYGMAVIFLVLLYNSPAGLVLYWTLNNVFSLVKNCYYAIKSNIKNTVIALCLSIFCVFMMYYMLAVHRGSGDLRVLIAGICGVGALSPWLFPVIKKSIRHLSAMPYSGKELLPLFVCSTLVFWSLAGLFIPSQLIGASPQEFSFIDSYTTPLFFVKNTALQTFGFFVFWPLCLYALFSGKVKKAELVVYLFAFGSAICNVFLFPGNYGLISVNLEFASSVVHSWKTTSANFLISLIPACALPLLLYTQFKKQIEVILVLCLIAFSGVSVVNMVKIQYSFTALAAYHSEEKNVQTVEPIFHFSKTGKNTVVIMLDRAASVFMPFIFEETPELKDIYSGFVFYPNTVSFNGYTRIGAPPVFGGYEYTPEETNKRANISLKQKHNESLLMMPRIFSEAGYAVTATDSPYANYSQKPDMRIYEVLPEVKTYITDGAYTDIWLKEQQFSLPSTSELLKRGIFWYSLLRVVPFAFREGIYMKGDWCSPVENRTMQLTLNGYSVLDYLPRLTDTEAPAENTALFLVNNLTHETSFLQAPDYVPVASVTNYGNGRFSKEKAYHINIAAMKRLADWFVYLKEAGVYENTRIILVSDHGPAPNFVTKIGLPFNVDQVNPLLMVKNFNASGSLKTDMTFMTNADVPVMALRSLFDDPINPFTGNRITDDSKKNPLYIAISGSIHLGGNPNTTRFTLNPKEDYYVHDNIFEAKNWEKAEK